MCASKNFGSSWRAVPKLFTAPLKFFELNLDEAGGVVDRRVVRVLLLCLRATSAARSSCCSSTSRLHARDFHAAAPALALSSSTLPALAFACSR